MRVLILLMLAAPAMAAPTPPATKKKPTVFVLAAKKTELHDALTYPAQVIPRIHAAVLADASGVLSKLFTPLGRRVKKNQKLMIIRHTDPVYQFAPVIVRTPVAGVVSEVPAGVGDQVNAGDRLAVITDPGQVIINIEVPSTDVSRLKVGMKGTFRTSRALDKEIEVRVQGISPFVDPATGTATSELVFHSKKKPSPGTVGRVEFQVSARKGYLLPDNAVVYKRSETFVRLVVDGKTKRVPVVLGKSQRGMVEILKGLEENAKVITRTSKWVGDGQEVEVYKPDAT